MIKGETVHSGAPVVCPECSTTTSNGVCRSAAGFYIGRVCDCGPYSRESKAYYPTYDLAREAFENGTWEPR